MLYIRDKIKPHVLYIVGNGLTISAWHDKWCAQGPLDRFISKRDLYDAKLSNEDCLADVIRNGKWNCPTEVDNSNKEERMVWLHGNDLKCALCKGCIDSHKHLFFECPFSKKIWLKVIGKGRFSGREINLVNVIGQLKRGSAKNSIWKIINKLILSATVYFIWKERNKRNF
ncbi:hypothetical protein Tco_1038611 [Tanacetum coccineum]